MFWQTQVYTRLIQFLLFIFVFVSSCLLFLNHLGSKIKIRDHYHSHRLSIWLSLIPRLHAPIDLPTTALSTQSTADQAEGLELSASVELPQLDSEKYFYLRHHLLPDHENLATYDGIVKQLTIKIPASKEWQSRYLRTNMTSFYEQQQQLLYGRVFGGSGGNVDNGLKTTGKVLGFLNANVKTDETGVLQQKQQQFAGRRIDLTTKNLEGKGEDGEGSKTHRAIDSSLPASSSNEEHDTKTIVAGTNGDGRLHFDAQTTSDTYSTALLVTIVVGCSLLVLNLLIFLGVYYQLDHKAPCSSEEAIPVDDEAIQTTEGASIKPKNNQPEEIEEILLTTTNLSKTRCSPKTSDVRVKTNRRGYSIPEGVSFCCDNNISKKKVTLRRFALINY